MPRLTAAKRIELEKKFLEYDKSGDGKLNFNEMKALLRKGSPDLDDAELKVLYNNVDKNHDGAVDFDEFLGYIYQDNKAVVAAPANCVAKFEEFCGKEMDGKEFAKLCIDAGLIDKSFRKEDIDVTFAKVLPRGKRKIDLIAHTDGFTQFDRLLCLVAEKKGCSPGEVHSAIAQGVKTSSGTVTEFVKFHDDKTTYTGAHAANEAHSVAEARASAPAAKKEVYDIGPEGSWAPCEATFKTFDKDGSGLDGRTFAKLCQDADLHDRRFEKNEVDVVFTKIHAKKLTFELFQDALREIAIRKEVPIKEIQGKVAVCSGPTVNATVADSVRFHDDKSTYTGMHAGK